MKNVFMILVATPLICLFVACGGNEQPQSIKLKPQKTEIEGDLKGYLEVVKADYELASDFGLKISIKVKAKKTFVDFDFENSGIDLGLSVLNASGSPISGIDKMMLSSSRDELEAILKKGSGEIVLEFNGFGETTDEAKTFIVSSTIEKYESSDSEEDSSEENTSSSEDFDQVLDDYEKYVNEMVALQKKMKNNDPAVLEEYTELMEKTQELAESMEDAKGNEELSTEQMTRFLNIQTKAMKALK